MRFINPASYDTADDYWDAVESEMHRDEGDRQAADDLCSEPSEDGE